MTPVEVLEKARALVATNWAQGGSDADDDARFHAPDATAVCAALALNRVEGKWTSAAQTALGKLEMAAGNACIPEWNDEPGRTKQDVLDAYDRAIQLAKDAAK